MSSSFPSLRATYISSQQDEHYLKEVGILKMVVRQGIPVRIELGLPGGHSKPEVCFPAPFHTRVYLGHPVPDNEIASSKPDYGDEDNFPWLLDYKFGMREEPWMFDSFLPRELRRAERTAVANYIIENGSFGHAGVIIQVTRREIRAEESMRIFSFDTGNDFQFIEKWKFHPKTQLLAEFIPVDPNARVLEWQSLPSVKR